MYNNTKSLITVAVLSALSLQAIAAEADAQEQEIEEISVVGKKISYANNLVAETMMEQQAPITSVMAVMDNLPGISINEGDAFGGDDWSTSITMRGFSIDGNQQQLGMTVDGIPNGGSNYGGGAKANRFLDSENMFTVEVAQGTSDISSASLEALGGTFNFVSIDPGMEQETIIAATIGQHEAQRFYVRHETGQIFGNTTAYISFSETSNQRWIGKGDNGGAERQHAEVKFVSDFGDLILTGRYSYDDVDEDNYNSVSVEQFRQTPDWDQLTWSWTGVPHLDQMYAEGWSTVRENQLAYLKAEYSFSPTTVLTVTPYMHKNTGRGDWIPPYLVYAVDENGNQTRHGGSIANRYGFTDEQGTPLAPAEGCTSNYTWPWNSGPGLHPACYDRDAVPVMSFRNTNYKKDRTGFLASIETTYDIHDIKAGLWYESTKRDENRTWHKVVDARVGMMADSDYYWMQYKNTFNTDTLKWYVQDTIDLDALTVNLGVQQYLVDVDKYDHFAGAKTADINSDSDVLVSAGAVYALDESTELFAGYSENFAAIKDLVLERDASALTDIEPETAENIDFGVRYRGDDITVSVTGYSIEFDNRLTFIAPGSDTGGIDYDIGTNGSYINVGGVESDGFEVSATYQVNQEWSLYGSFTSNDSTYVGNAPGFNSGDKVIDSVDDMWVLSADYIKDRLRYGVSAKYTGERTSADDYTVVDMYLGYNIASNGETFKSMDISLVVNNIFDKRYLSTGTGNGTTYFIGAPKTAALTFTASF